MKRPVVVVALLVGFAVAALAGYTLGSRSERSVREAAVEDAQSSKTLIVVRREILLLTEMRQKKHLDMVKDAELWTVLQLQQLDPSRFAKGSSSEFLYRQTIELVNAYRKQFPDTIIDPEKDKTIAKAFGK